MRDLKIRLATSADLPAINAIYNHYVRYSTATYQTELESDDDRLRWFASHGPSHPVTVAILDNAIVGWGALSRFHQREAYSQTVENSVYVRFDLHKRGIGGAILADLIDRGRALGHRTIIAAIDSEQEASLALHRRFGFVKAGNLNQVGFKFDRWLDVIYMQLLL